MGEHDAFAERGRALEEQYFQRRERELIEKMRKAAAAEQERGALGEKTGLQDSSLLQELQDMGFTPDTVMLLPLVPVLEVAWAEGGITSSERHLLLKLARSRGVDEDSAADRQLQAWMSTRPEPLVFERAGRLIAALLTSGSEQARAGLTGEDLVAHCEKIAAISGGILGMGYVSREERELLSRIASDLKTRQR